MEGLEDVGVFGGIGTVLLNRQGIRGFHSKA